MSEETGYVATENFSDFFSFSETRKFHLPDHVSWIEFKVFNEGDKAKFQKQTGRDVRVNTRTNDATLKSDVAADRHALILTACIDWNLRRGGTPVTFGDRSVRDFLQLANPKIVEDLELEIRKANPWLLGDMTVEDIDREIENLNEMRKIAEEREASGKF